MGVKSVLLFLLWLFSGFHPVHVSVMNIAYDENNQVFHCVLKAFREDLHHNLAMKSGSSSAVHDHADHSSEMFTPENLMDYINNQIFIRVNEHNVDSMKYNRMESDEESIWIFFSFRHTQAINSITVQNRFMMDMFEDQTNLVIISLHDVEQGFTLDIKNDKAMINY